jgi:hypothetical protein
MFPDYNWLPWRFENCPDELWTNVENQTKFMDWAGKQLNVKETSDWYKVTNQVTLNVTIKY